MDYFDDLLSGDGPVAREVTYRGKAKTVHFRRITGGERVKLVAGQKMQLGGGKDRAGSMEMDLGDLTRNRHLLVQFAVVTEEGKQVFANIAAVQALPDGLVAELATHADAVNDDSGEAGNA
jgi:hypothetical protein